MFLTGVLGGRAHGKGHRRPGARSSFCSRIPLTQGLTMANPTSPPNNAEKNAQKFFKKAEQSDTLAKRTRKKEKSDYAAKTAKLRGLRLAKETVEKAEADKQAAEKTEAMTDAQREKQRKRAAIVKPAARIRMTY